MKLTTSILILMAFTYSGCRQTDFLYYVNQQPPPNFSFTHKIKEMQGQSMVDILWVVDNSGSMGTYQQQVINNADMFIREFTKKTVLDWRIGLISTDKSDMPYIGLATGDTLDKFVKDPISAFQGAVARLGTDGSYMEQTFEPVEKALTLYPSFMRDDAILALVIVTDAPEQSAFKAKLFIDFLEQKKSGLDKVVSYGVFGPQDYGCKETDDYWEYTGSKYEELITATHGKTYVLCSNDYGRILSDLGQDLISRTKSPTLYFKIRPRPTTILVKHKGIVLPGGPKSSGGYWMYNFELNAIVFHDLDFAPSEDEEVQVSFDVDTGEDLIS
ncbi:MAG: vWA domain-containing protein [Bdellovibrionota bacterium]